MLLKNNVNDTIMAFDMSFTNKGKDTIKKLARDEKMINYGKLIFETGNPDIKNFDFFKTFGTLYELFTDLLDEKISMDKATQEQIGMIEKIEEL